MKIYISEFDKQSIDTRYLLDLCKDKQGVSFVSKLAECELFLIMVGSYLSYGSKEVIESDLKEAMKSGKRILAICPYGSNYLPKYFQDLGIGKLPFNKTGIKKLFK